MHQLDDLEQGTKISVFTSDGICHQVIFSHYEHDPEGVITIFAHEDDLSIRCDAIHVIVCRDWVQETALPMIDIKKVVYAH